MALRNNVYDTKLELWHLLKPLEYYLVDIIIDKTIKWRQKEAVISIQEFCERTKQADTHIYSALRNLKNKNIINWHKNKHGSMFGLNENFFGGLLIKKHEDALQARRNKIKVIVDNSKNTDEIRYADRRISSVEQTKFVSSSDESRQSEQSQAPEITKERHLLKTFFKDININTSLKDNQKPKESFTLSRNGNGEMTEGQKQERLKLLKSQAEMLALEEKKKAGSA